MMQVMVALVITSWGLCHPLQPSASPLVWVHRGANCEYLYSVGRLCVLSIGS